MRRPRAHGRQHQTALESKQRITANDDHDARADGNHTKPHQTQFKPHDNRAQGVNSQFISCNRFITGDSASE